MSKLFVYINTRFYKAQNLELREPMEVLFWLQKSMVLGTIHANTVFDLKTRSLANTKES